MSDKKNAIINKGYHPILWVLLGIITLGIGCSDESNDIQSCTGEVLEANGSSYCVKENNVIVEEGFECPPDMNFYFEVEGFGVCSSTETLPDELFGQLELPSPASQGSFNALTVLGKHSEGCQGDRASSICAESFCGTLDFVMETDRASFVQPGMQLQGLSRPLTPGDGAITISFTNNWLFQIDDGSTEGSPDIDMSRVGRDKQCSEASDCAANFECKIFAPTELPSNAAHLETEFYENGASGVCATPAQVTWRDGSLHYMSLRDDPQPENNATSALGFQGLTLAVLMDNSGSLDGLNESGFIDPDTKTDPNLERSKAIKIFIAELFDEERSGLLDRSEISLSSLNGNSVNGVTDVFKIDQSFQSSFITDAQATAKSQARNSNQSVFNHAIDDLRGPLGGKTPLWEALIQSAEFFAQESTQVVTSGYARRAIAFTDGPSDGSLGNANAETTLQSLATVNAEASIVHLDSLQPEADKRDRVGPSPDYERVACESGGYYNYDVWAESLEGHFRRFSKSYEGRWSISMDVSATIADGETTIDLPDGWYRLGTTMGVSIDESTKTHHLFAEKSLFGLSGEYTDSRLLIQITSE